MHNNLVWFSFSRTLIIKRLILKQKYDYKSGNCISKYLSKKSELIYKFKTQIVKNGRLPIRGIIEVQDKSKISTR